MRARLKNLEEQPFVAPDSVKRVSVGDQLHPENSSETTEKQQGSRSS